MRSFGRFPTGSAARLRGATGNACKVFLALSEYWSADWRAWPSRDTLAASSGLPANRISEGFAELRALGLIVEDGWRNRVKRHAIPPEILADQSAPPDVSGQADGSEGADGSGQADGSEGAESVVRPSGSTGPAERTQNKEEQREQKGEPPTPKGASKKPRMVLGFRRWGGVSLELQEYATKRVLDGWEELGWGGKKPAGAFDSKDGLGAKVRDILGRGYADRVSDPCWWDRLINTALDKARRKGKPKFFGLDVLDLLDAFIAQDEERRRTIAKSKIEGARASEESAAAQALSERIERARGGDLKELEALEAEGAL